jgi:lia operon protein LiaG
MRQRLAPGRTGLLAVLAVLALTTALPAQQGEQFRLRGDQVALFNLAGELRVEAGTLPDVVVEVARGGRDAGRMRVETGRIDGSETLRVVTPGDRIVYPRMNRGSRSELRVHDDGTFARGGLIGRRVTVAGSGSGVQAYADLRVSVPPGRRIRLHQGTGQVWVSNVDGQIAVETSAAPVHVDGTRGVLDVTVGSGRVTVRDAFGQVGVAVASGNVLVTRMRGSRLVVTTGTGGLGADGVDVTDLNVGVGSGSVRLSEVRIRDGAVRTGNGGVQIELASPLQSLRVNTGSGSVSLTIPPEFGADLQISTGSGGINVDGPLQNLRRTRGSLSARLRGGEARVNIDTGAGGVRVRDGA